MVINNCVAYAYDEMTFMEARAFFFMAGANAFGEGVLRYSPDRPYVGMLRNCFGSYSEATVRAEELKIIHVPVNYFWTGARMRGFVEYCARTSGRIPAWEVMGSFMEKCRADIEEARDVLEGWRV